MPYGSRFCHFLSGYKPFSLVLDVYVGRYASPWFVVDHCGTYIWLMWIVAGRCGWFRVLVTTLFMFKQFKCLHDEGNQGNITF